jgi:putative MATE family efflux protein
MMIARTTNTTTTAYHNPQKIVVFGTKRMVQGLTMDGQYQPRGRIQFPSIQQQAQRKRNDICIQKMIHSSSSSSSSDSSSNKDSDETSVSNLSHNNNNNNVDDDQPLLSQVEENSDSVIGTSRPTNDPTNTTTTTTTTTQKKVVLSTEDAAVVTNSIDHKINWTKENLAIALPALMGLLADPLLSIVDTGFVGQMGGEGGAIDLAALGVCTSIFHMAFTVFRASTVATTSLIGSATSDTERRQITQISLFLAAAMGTVVTVALRFGGRRILSTMGVPTAGPSISTATSTLLSPLYQSASTYLFIRCWAAPAVVGMVVAEGAFRGTGDNRTPFLASSVAAGVNLLLDSILMLFPLKMGMAGAALATALSQVCAFGLYGWRLWKRNLLPQRHDEDDDDTSSSVPPINVVNVITSILGANAAMLGKNFSMLVFYTSATAIVTRMGPAHVAAHQVCLSLFWLTTMWLDSSSVSSQILLSRHLQHPSKAKSLIKYMTKFAVLQGQGLVLSAGLVALRRVLPTIFTTDPIIIEYVSRCLPHVAFQQTIVSVCLAWEGLIVGGNQFKCVAIGTATCTLGGVMADVQGNIGDRYMGIHI